MSPLLTKSNWHRSKLIFPMQLGSDRAAEALAAATAQGRDAVLIVELTAVAGQISHHVLTDAPAAGFVNQTLRAHLPGLRIEADELDRPSFTHGLEFKLSTHERPLRTDAQAVSAAALLSAMHDLKDDEAVRLQWLLRPAKGVRPVQRPPKDTQAQPSALEQLLVPPNHPADVTREALAKRASPLLQAIGRVAVTAATRPRRRQLIGRVLGALGTNNRPGVGIRYRMIFSSDAARRLNTRYLPWLHWPMLLNSQELVALIGWPVEAGAVAGLERGHASTLPVPAAVPSSGRVLADANDGSHQSHRPFGYLIGCSTCTSSGRPAPVSPTFWPTWCCRTWLLATGWW